MNRLREWMESVENWVNRLRTFDLNYDQFPDIDPFLRELGLPYGAEVVERALKAAMLVRGSEYWGCLRPSDTESLDSAKKALRGLWADIRGDLLAQEREREELDRVHSTRLQYFGM